jgi:Zn-dependent metalloprotease
MHYGIFALVCALMVTACTTDSKSNEAQELYTPMKNNIETQSAGLPAPSPYAKYAYAYLEQQRTKFYLLDPQKQLTFISENIDQQNNKHVRFQQVYEEVPIWGHEIIVHLDDNNQVYHVSGEVLTGIQNLNTKPALSPDRVKHLIKQNDPWASEGWKVHDSELYIFNLDGNNYLTYRMTLMKGLLREFLFVSANDGSIVHKISGTPTATRF